MFLLHPKIAQLVNARAVHTPFVKDGLNGSVGSVLYAQQANRLLVMGHQSLVSSGGTASLCGGGAGPGSGPAGAGGAAFSGASSLAAGGSNGACGGVPVGGQEIGRGYDLGKSPAVGRASPYYIDDVTFIAPMLPPGFGGSLLRSSGSVGAGGVGLTGGIPSGNGVATSDMVLLGNFPGRSIPKPRGGPTCPTNKKK